MITSNPSSSDAPEVRSNREYFVKSSSFLPVLKVVTVCVGIAVFIWSAVYAIQLVRVASILGLRGKTPAVVAGYDRLFGSRTDFSDLTIPGTLGPVQMRVYTPTNTSNPAPIVLIHGFVLKGNQDEHTNQVAAGLASMGYLVALPTVPGESHFEMRSTDLPVIRDAIRWTASTTKQRVALFGVSFGGGLVIPAAAPADIAKDVKLIFCISGYNNLDSIGHYYIHDPVSGPDGKPYVGTPPPPGPLMIVSPYLDEMVSAKDAAKLGPVIAHFLAENQSPDLPHATVESREFDELQNADTPQIRELYRGILLRHRAEIASISPASVLGTLRIPLFVLHGTTDQVLPEGEIEWMRKEVAGNRDAHFLVSPWVSHARVGERTSAWQKIRVLTFCTNMLRRASRKAALNPSPKS
jgi:pimeloyl-ACP methyl ester carboxylesterase